MGVKVQWIHKINIGWVRKVEPTMKYRRFRCNSRPIMYDHYSYIILFDLDMKLREGSHKVGLSFQQPTGIMHNIPIPLLLTCTWGMAECVALQISILVQVC